MTEPQVSVVIPVFNEEAVLGRLFERLYPALDLLSVTCEVILVDDGSTDRSAEILRAQFRLTSARTRVIYLAHNVGQHMAVLAGFAQARGERVVTLDADLQNPPEEIAGLLATMDRGHDYVGGVRRNRRDSFWRAAVSRGINWLRQKTTRIRMTDHGCMLRAYDRRVINAILRSGEASTFVPALAYTYARSPVEVEVAHDPRPAGTSKYSLWKLIGLNFDLMTGFTVAPLRLFSLLGMTLSALSAMLVGYLAFRRLWFGPEAEGVFTLFGILFFLIGIVLFGIGLLGEYVARIYEQVRARPRYVVQEILQSPEQRSNPVRREAA